MNNQLSFSSAYVSFKELEKNLDETKIEQICCNELRAKVVATDSTNNVENYANSVRKRIASTSFNLKKLTKRGKSDDGVKATLASAQSLLDKYKDIVPTDGKLKPLHKANEKITGGENNVKIPSIQELYDEIFDSFEYEERGAYIQSLKDDIKRMFTEDDSDDESIENQSECVNNQENKNLNATITSRLESINTKTLFSNNNNNNNNMERVHHSNSIDQLFEAINTKDLVQTSTKCDLFNEIIDQNNNLNNNHISNNHTNTNNDNYLDKLNYDFISFDDDYLQKNTAFSILNLNEFEFK